MLLVSRLFLGGLIWVFALAAFAVAEEEQRFALVVGNSDYSAGALKIR